MTEGNAERVTSIREQADSNPAAVDVADVVEILVHGRRDERESAIEAYDAVVQAQPDTTNDAAAALETFLTHESADVRRRGAETANVLIERTADGFDPLVSHLCSLATDPTESAREPAVLALARLAFERPNTAAPASDALCTMACARVVGPDNTRSGLSSDDRTSPRDPTIRTNPERERRDHLRVRAIAGLTRIAAERPEAVRDRISDIVTLLEDENHNIRTGACEILESLALEFPDDVEPYTTVLTDRVNEDLTHPVRRRAADALEAIANEYPDRVSDEIAESVPALEPVIKAREPSVRRTGLQLLLVTAQRNPDAVDVVEPLLRDRRTDPDEHVSTLATQTLEQLGRETSVMNDSEENSSEHE